MRPVPVRHAISAAANCHVDCSTHALAHAKQHSAYQRLDRQWVFIGFDDEAGINERSTHTPTVGQCALARRTFAAWTKTAWRHERFVHHPIATTTGGQAALMSATVWDGADVNSLTVLVVVGGEFLKFTPVERYHRSLCTFLA